MTHEREAELLNILAGLRLENEKLSAMLDHQRDEAMESERMYLAEFARLKSELAKAKPKRASTLPAPRHGPCNYPYWRILEVTV